MRRILIIFFLCVNQLLFVTAQQQNPPEFTWGNTTYFNINIGESVEYNGVEIKLLKLENHFNQIKIGDDTIWIKVSRRTLPELIGNLRIFVADNKNVKALSSDKKIHGLLKKDALVCLSMNTLPLLDPNKYLFPISFNDGFQWSVDEDSYMFSSNISTKSKSKEIATNTGVDFDLQDARGIKRHWIVAIENSTVVRAVASNIDKGGKEAAVLLRSETQPDIFYLYEHLYNKNLVVKSGQKLMRGELIGTIWGDENWGHLTFSVIRSDTIPGVKNYQQNIVSCFPQLFGLYFKQTTAFPKYFSKGRIFFGKASSQNGNQKNTGAYEMYSGKGWDLGKWNVADKVEFVSKGSDGNVRLGKKLFENTAAVCTNPNDYYDYEINVYNGVYRIRAKVGDFNLPTRQKVVFESIETKEISNNAGQFTWTPEKVVKVNDGKLTVRIFVDKNNEISAGISEIVFQRAL
jgi:hypothetical protein